MDITFIYSPNKNTRSGHKIDTVVLHATAGALWPSINWLRNPNSGVSTHYVIAKTGKIYQLVEEDYMAWHAGVSQMPDGRTGVNWFSIGIELENNNDGSDPYPEEQINSLVWLLRNIKDRLSIPRKNVVTHAEIALPPGRKTDPRGLDVDAVLDRVYNTTDRKLYEKAVFARWMVEEAVRSIENKNPDRAREILLELVSANEAVLYEIENYFKEELNNA